jgi:ribosome-associated protein
MYDIDETEDTPEKSKSQVKRELLALQDLGRELVNLAPKALQKMPLTEKTREAIIQARQLRMGALARQLKHIGKLMRDEDVETIRAVLDQENLPHQVEVEAFHEVESWRDGLIAGEEGLFELLCGRFVDLDRQHLHQLIRESKKEQALNKPPKSGRALFRYLKELAEGAAGTE